MKEVSLKSTNHPGMSTPRPRASRVFSRVLCVAFGLVASGCGAQVKVGMTKQPVTPQRAVPLVCIENQDGRAAKFLEGEVQGRPAVQLDGVISNHLSATLNEPVDVDGARIFAGQLCARGGLFAIFGSRPVCAGYMVVKDGERRVVAAWDSILQAQGAAVDPTFVADSPQALVQEWSKRGLLAKLQLVKLDAASFKAFAELSKARSDAATVRRVTNALVMGAGAAAAGVGQAKHNEGLIKAGKKTMDLGRQIDFDIDDDDRPYIDKHPELLPLLKALVDVHVLCVGGAPVRPPS
jgi:hypothetical protein